MKIQTLTKMIAVSAFLALAACGKSNSDNRHQTRGNGTAPAAQGQNSLCGGASGGVYEDGNGLFRDNVLGLISATMDPNQFGNISGTPGSNTGVDMSMKLNRSGNTVHAANSKLRLVIWDSYVGQASQANPGQTIQPYPVTLDAQSVVADGNALVVTFGDSYGTIAVRINEINNNIARGTVSYSNTQHALGGMPASGHLGAFVVPLCQ